MKWTAFLLALLAAVPASAGRTVLYRDGIPSRIVISKPPVTLVYFHANDSTNQSHDVIAGFDVAHDKIDVRRICRKFPDGCTWTGYTGRMTLDGVPIGGWMYYPFDTWFGWQTALRLNVDGNGDDAMLIWFEGDIAFTRANMRF